MNYQNILITATNKIGTEFPDVINDIEYRISAGSTGGEIIGMVGKYLKDLEMTNPAAYSILIKEIEEYISDCKRIGRIIK